MHIIPIKQNSTAGNGDMDWSLYKYRHLGENLFARLKHFRAIATRYDKLKALSLWPALSYGYRCKKATAPSQP